MRFQPPVGTECYGVGIRDLETFEFGKVEDLFSSEEVSSEKVNHG